MSNFITILIIYLFLFEFALCGLKKKKNNSASIEAARRSSASENSSRNLLKAPLDNDERCRSSSSGLLSIALCGRGIEDNSASIEAARDLNVLSTRNLYPTTQRENKIELLTAKNPDFHRKMKEELGKHEKPQVISPFIYNFMPNPVSSVKRLFKNKGKSSGEK